MGYKMYENYKMSEYGSLMFQNIQALANGEDSDVVCVSQFNETCTVTISLPEGPDGAGYIITNIKDRRKEE